LSQQRAAAVKHSLEAAGVDADRIEAAGRGADKPVADNASDAGRAQNRRTELVVVER
jgi:outer membrane protein OmpA-like peptidoglycan-associated protein